MSANDAFTAGVRPGGLTSSTEIRLLLCYLVKNAGPITRQEIENALMEEALVNYFEIGSCLDDITKQALVTLTGDSYTITLPIRAARWRRSLPTTCPAVCGSALWPLCCAARHGPARKPSTVPALPKKKTATAPSAAR